MCVHIGSGILPLRLCTKRHEEARAKYMPRNASDNHAMVRLPPAIYRRCNHGTRRLSCSVAITHHCTETIRSARGLVRVGIQSTRDRSQCSKAAKKRAPPSAPPIGATKKTAASTNHGSSGPEFPSGGPESSLPRLPKTPARVHAQARDCKSIMGAGWGWELFWYSGFRSDQPLGDGL